MDGGGGVLSAALCFVVHGWGCAVLWWVCAALCWGGVWWGVPAKWWGVVG
jgi:hypothetical protein